MEEIMHGSFLHDHLILGSEDQQSILEAKCRAVEELISALSILPETCRTNIQILPHKVVSTIVRTAPSLHHLIVKTLARCMELDIYDDDIQLTDEDADLNRIGMTALIRSLYKFDSASQCAKRANSMLSEGVVWSFNSDIATDLHLPKLLKDLLQQTADVNSQFCDSKHRTVRELTAAWPLYDSGHFLEMLACKNGDEKVEAEARLAGAKALLDMLLGMDASERRAVTVIPRFITSQLDSVTLEALNHSGFAAKLAEVLSYEVDDCHEQCGDDDAAISYLYLATVMGVACKYEPMIYAKATIDALAKNFSLKYCVDTAESVDLKGAFEQLVAQSKNRALQVRAVNAGIGREFFRVWFPANKYDFQELREYTGKCLPSGRPQRASEEFAVYAFFKEQMAQCLSASSDERIAAVEAWYLTKSQFDDILPLSSFVRSYSSGE